MCDPAVIEFVRTALDAEGVRGRSVLDVGSRMVQQVKYGATDQSELRAHIEALEPARYLGVDILPGPGVDEIASVYELEEKYGEDSFDIVLCTEVVEHVEDWRSAFSNLKAVTRPRGLLLVTTRSPGFAYHGWPHDYWRYTIADFARILRDFETLELTPDFFGPGVLYLGQKPSNFEEADVAQIPLATAFRGRPRLHAPPRWWIALYVLGLQAFRAVRRLAR